MNAEDCKWPAIGDNRNLEQLVKLYKNLRSQGKKEADLFKDIEVDMQSTSPEAIQIATRVY